MYYCTSVKFDKRRDFFVCSTHRHRKDQCSAHYIRAVVLEDMVLRHMRTVISYVTTHEAHFRTVMGDKLKLASDEAIRVNKLYEDRVNGTISDERFASMSKSYEDEQSQLKKEVDTLTKEMDQQAQNADDVERFIAQAHRYVGLEELTPCALHELVKAIYIEAPDESSGKRRQNIHISYDFVGFIPIYELMQEEMA